jgi:serine-type D-Ala-D-Ala carboxypeptidase (penicillin-binding protein 5/6)
VRLLLRRSGVGAIVGGMVAVISLAGGVLAGPVHASVAAPRAASGAGARGRAAAGPDVVAAEGELVNLTSGRRLWSRGMNGARPVASITKVMTALVVLHAGHLGRRIRVTYAAEEYARAHDASSAGLHPGDVLTTRQLLEGLLLPSGADAAYLLATSYGPGRLAFVARMNATARRLGMTGTHFSNFDGLPWPTEESNYSTPRSLLLLARAVLARPMFRGIVAQRRHRIAPAAAHHGYLWRNTNLLLRRYPAAIGIKTGFTAGAGYCLLFAARRRGQLLAGVVLDTSVTNPGLRFSTAASLLNWGYRRVR